MQTTVLVETTTYKQFQGRCSHFGLDCDRSLTNAVSLRMSNPNNWKDEALMGELAIGKQPMVRVPIFLGDKFFWRWRAKYVPESLFEVATIRLALRDWAKLSMQQSHDLDFMATQGLVLNVR